jgi:membrane protease YdiL (CAAX protease family)
MPVPEFPDSAPERAERAFLDAPPEFILDGRLEKAAFPPLISGLLGLILAFILFQGISLVVTLLLLLTSGVGMADMVENLEQVLAMHSASILVANTVGQFFGLLLPAILLTRLHSSEWKSFLRLRMVDGKTLVLSVVALLALIPVVQWFGVLSDQLPWPDSIRNFEQAQMDLIERILTQDFSLVFTIMVLALTPAICEEVLFRGYFQRQTERSTGIVWGILLSGIVFGLYHLRLTQAIPLSMLGVFLAYITWRTNSILPAVLVHLANNSFAAILGKVASREGASVDIESFEMPITIVIPAALVLIGVLITLHRHAALQQAIGNGIKREERS